MSCQLVEGLCEVSPWRHATHPVGADLNELPDRRSHREQGDRREENILRTCKQAREVLEKNKRAVVVFTRGLHFSCDDTSHGEAGKWHVNRSVLEPIDQVIFYLRRADENVNRIFPRNYAGIQKSNLPV